MGIFTVKSAGVRDMGQDLGRSRGIRLCCTVAIKKERGQRSQHDDEWTAFLFGFLVPPFLVYAIDVDTAYNGFLPYSLRLA